MKHGNLGDLVKYRPLREKSTGGRGDPGRGDPYRDKDVWIGGVVDLIPLPGSDLAGAEGDAGEVGAGSGEAGSAATGGEGDDRQRGQQ